MNNLTQARHNMVESQVRPNDVTDPHIIAAMRSIPRENFLPTSLRSLAYMDDDIVVKPASGGNPARHVLAPMVFAKMLQLADIKPGELVLDIGCCTGYSSAVLSRLTETVVGLESDEELATQASTALEGLGVDNAAIVTGPLAEGYPSQAPYNVIMINGIIPEVPNNILDQLSDGGRLVAIIGENTMGRAALLQSFGGEVSKRYSFHAGAPHLPGFEVEPQFSL